MSLDMNALQQCLESHRHDGWFTCFETVGIAVEGLAPGDPCPDGLDWTAEGWNLLYVRDREKFLEALVRIHGQEAVLDALLELEEG